MAFGDAFSSFLTGFQQGYGFVEDIKDKEAEREFKAARTTALQEEYSPKAMEMKRRESAARVAGMETTNVFNQAKLADYPEDRAREYEKQQSEQRARLSEEPYRAAVTENVLAEKTTRDLANAKEADYAKLRANLFKGIGGQASPGLYQKTAIPEPGAVTPGVTSQRSSGALNYAPDQIGYSANPVAAKDMPAHRVALLNTIAMDESAGKYNIRYTPRGGVEFNDFSKHPAIFEPTLDGRDQSSAAGRYQFTKTTWDEMGGGAFTPEMQDKRAWELAAQRYKQKTGDDLDRKLQEEGMDTSVVQALSGTWEAFQKNDPNKYVTAYSSELQRTQGGEGTALDAANAMARPRLAPPNSQLQQIADEAVREGIYFAQANLGATGEGVPTPEGDAAADMFLTGGAAAKDPDVKKYQKLTKEMVEEQTGIEPTLSQTQLIGPAAMWFIKASEGDHEGAKAAAAELIQWNMMMTNAYTSIAQAAASDKDLDGTIKALVKAHAYIPDGVDIQLDKRGDTIVVQKFDTLSGESLGEEEIMKPDDIFVGVMKMQPKTFMDAIAASGGRREAMVTPEYQTAVNATAGFKAIPDAALGAPVEAVNQGRMFADQQAEQQRAASTANRPPSMDDYAKAIEQTATLLPEMAKNYGFEVPTGPVLEMVSGSAERIMAQDKLPHRDAVQIALAGTYVDPVNPDKPTNIVRPNAEKKGMFDYFVLNPKNPESPPQYIGTVSAVTHAQLAQAQGLRVQQTKVAAQPAPWTGVPGQIQQWWQGLPARTPGPSDIPDRPQAPGMPRSSTWRLTPGFSGTTAIPMPHR